jgi:Enoyl-(Acyl carrier protein) reductase
MPPERMMWITDYWEAQDILRSTSFAADFHNRHSYPIVGESILTLERDAHLQRRRTELPAAGQCGRDRAGRRDVTSPDQAQRLRSIAQRVGEAASAEWTKQDVDTSSSRPFGPLYSMTKGGIVLLMRSLAVRLGPEGIRSNAILPAMIETPMLSEFFGGESGADIEDLKTKYVSSVPLGRAAGPEEVASVAASLASDDAGGVTGVALPADGGFLAK